MTTSALFNLNTPLHLRASTRTTTSPCFATFRFGTKRSGQCRLICNASSAAGSSAGSNNNPYEILGVSQFEGFDMIKAAYNRRRKDAEIRGDEAYLDKLESAYDTIMMSQLSNRKKGLTVSSFKVSKDIKYADKLPIIPWGPRFSKSGDMDMKINVAISAVFTAWVFIKRSAEYKPLQFMAFVFVYRIFEKLKSFEPQQAPTYNDEGIEDESRAIRMGKRLIRSLALVFGCVALASLAYTGILNAIEFSGRSIPVSLYNSQELIVTTISAVGLYIMATFYR